MKWFFGLVLVIALIAGGLYGVGYFFIPNNLDVSRATTIDRPRAAVFAMSNDLKIVREWSPYYADDPDAEYTFGGNAPGDGQSMRWVSTVRSVGSGRVQIVRSELNHEVESIITLERATLGQVMRFERMEGGGTNVTWAVNGQCPQTWQNVPCRYMNLIVRTQIAKSLEQGLARLKTLAEELPNVDFEDLRADFEPVEPQSYVFSVASTSTTDQGEVDRAEAVCIGDVQRFMSANALTASGPLVRVTTDWNAEEQRMSFRVGYPFQGPRPLTVATVQIGETPSGRAMHVTHRGPRAQMRTTYAKIFAYLRAHRMEVREEGLPWEVVVHEAVEGDPRPTEIEIYVPLQ